MVKVLDFKIEYREKGIKKFFPVKIDFVSNWCIREFSEIFSETSAIKSSWDNISDYTSEISALKTERPEDYKTKIEEIKKKAKEETDYIMSFAEKNFIKRRYELVKQLLIDNGVSDEVILSESFWDRQVEPGHIMQFISDCIYKDMNKKKAQ